MRELIHSDLWGGVVLIGGLLLLLVVAITPEGTRTGRAFSRLCGGGCDDDEPAPE